jgi:hypothetical protein
LRSDASISQLIIERPRSQTFLSGRHPVPVTRTGAGLL